MCTRLLIFCFYIRPFSRRLVCRGQPVLCLHKYRTYFSKTAQLLITKAIVPCDWNSRNHYWNHIKSILRKCNIPESQLEALAEDRVLWSLTCATGLKNLAAAAEQAASDRRARRHAAAAATPAGPVCPHCGRICASDFGLRSHLCVGRWTRDQ